MNWSIKSTLNTLELKEAKGTDFIVGWNSKGVYAVKLKPLYTSFLRSTKISEYRMGIKFDNTVLAVEQNNNVTRIANAYVL